MASRNNEHYAGKCSDNAKCFEDIHLLQVKEMTDEGDPDWDGAQHNRRIGCVSIVNSNDKQPLIDEISQ